jgi:hypothetical protein
MDDLLRESFPLSACSQNNRSPSKLYSSTNNQHHFQLTMPAIRPSEKTASSVANALRNGKAAPLTKKAAERLFMPAFSHATVYVPKPTSAVSDPKKPNNTRRNFSSAAIHEHDKVREQWRASSEVIDYWKVHQSEHLNVDRSEWIDYWKDHWNTHAVDKKVDDSMSVLQLKPLNKMIGHRTFSTNSGSILDYWTNHNDTHFTDCWIANTNAHV